jgi:hypothetical protein
VEKEALMPTITERLQEVAARSGVVIPAAAPIVAAPVKAAVVPEVTYDTNERALRELLAGRRSDIRRSAIAEALGSVRVHDIVLDVITATRHNDRSLAIGACSFLEANLAFDEIADLSVKHMIEALELRVVSPVPTVSEMTRWLLDHRATAEKIVGAWRYLPKGLVDDDLAMRVIEMSRAMYLNESTANDRLSPGVVARVVLEHPAHLHCVESHRALTEKMLLGVLDGTTDWEQQCMILRIMDRRGMHSRAIGQRVRRVLDGAAMEVNLHTAKFPAKWFLDNWKASGVDEIYAMTGTNYDWMLDCYAKNVPTVTQVCTMLTAHPKAGQAMVEAYFRGTGRYFGGSIGAALLALAETTPQWLLDAVATAYGVGPRLRGCVKSSQSALESFEKVAMRSLEHAMTGCSDIVRERIWNSLGSERSLFDSGESFVQIVATFVARDREAADRKAAKKSPATV